MKRYGQITAMVMVATLVITTEALAQGFAPGGGSAGTGIIAQIVSSALNYVIIPAIDIAIFYHAITLMMGGHRMVGIFEAACGIALISLHSQIVGMVPV